MGTSFIKRATAGLLSAVTLFSSAVFEMPRAKAAGDWPSELEIHTGETYTVYDEGAQAATFKQNGAGRNVWPMYTKASDGSDIRAYCADHTKSNPSAAGKTYTVTGSVTDMRLYGVATYTDSRLSREKFIAAIREEMGLPFTTGNFSDWQYFCASQAAIWAALGDVQIAAHTDTGDGVLYQSSTSLGYRASGKTLTATTTEEALTLAAAIFMLKKGNDFHAKWGSGGIGHAPWIATRITCSPGSTTYNKENAKYGTIDLQGGIVASGVFAEKEISGQTYLVLPMAAASATPINQNNINIQADDLPAGAFIMRYDGTKNDSTGYLRLWDAVQDNTLFDNLNKEAYGETFLFCIPKATAEQMDAAGQKLTTKFTSIIPVNRYAAYVAATAAAGVQPVVLVEPALQLKKSVLTFNSETVAEDKNTLKVLKTDEAGAPLEGCAFQIRYQSAGQTVTQEATTDGNGEAAFEGLPLNTDVTVKETAAPEGYTLLTDKVVNTGAVGGKTIEVKLADSDDHVFRLHKTSSADGRNLMGAKFEVRGIDNDFVNTYTTDALGEFTIQGRDLPVGSFEAYEIAAPEGYMTDGSDVQTFSWDNTRDITLSSQNAPLPGIQIYKYDKETKMPLAGASFEIRRDGQSLQTLKTDINGYARMTNLSKGFYQVVETEAPQGYLKDELVHEVYIDPTADPTQLIREVNVPNTKKLSIRVVKQDRESKTPLAGWKFDVYYNDAKLTSVTTNGNGEALLENLQPGTYRVAEVNGDQEHYNMDAPEQTVELHRDQAKISTLIFQNTIKKHFGIYKVDSETLKPISGVVFEIWKDGTLLGNYTTGADGRIWLPYAEPGTYQAKEVMTDPRYVLNEKTFTIENNSEYPTFFTIPNVMKKDITVKKIDKDTGRPLQGVVFEAMKDGQRIGYFTTGADGKFTIPYADSGTYIFKEYHTLSGYVLNRDPVVIEHTTAKATTITVENRKRPSLRIIKQDAGTGERLAGAAFSVKKVEGAAATTVTTDENGEALLRNMDTGAYVIRETAAPDGYLLNDKEQTITLTQNQTGTVVFQNDRKPTLTINKVDSITKDPVKGAKFEVVYAVNNSFTGDLQNLGTFFTDENGEITLTKLQDGWYRVTEVEPAAGYAVKEPAEQTCFVQAGTDKTLTFENTPLSALIIKKIDADSGAVLQGANFRVRYLGGTSGTGGTVIGEYTTSANGTIVMTGLKAGTYVVEEIKAPAGYEMDDTPKTVYLSGKEQDVITVTFSNGRHGGLIINKIDSVTGQLLAGAEFKITASDGSLVGNFGGTVTSNGIYTTDRNGQIRLVDLKPDTYVVTETKAPKGYLMDSASQTVKVDQNDTQTLTFTNTPIGGGQIIKVDAESGKRIKGVQFEIARMNGERIGTYTTDSSGVITLPQLADGWYTATEIKAASGYLLDAAPHNFEVKAGRTTTLTIENTKASSILIHKIDSVTGKGIYGVTFLVSDGRGNPIGQYTTDQNGYIYIDKRLTDGKYLVREMQAAEGYVLDTTVRTFYVEYGATSTITWKNMPTMGQIQLMKKSSDDNLFNGLPAGTPLPGATFEIYNRAGNLVDTVVTGQNGIAISDTLPLGRYTIRETKAPLYYNTVSQPIEAEIEFSGQIVRLEVLNKSVYTNVSVSKRGYRQVVPAQTIRYDFSSIANNSNVPLNSFYWRDTLPVSAVRLTKIITGTWNQMLGYKVVYKTNLHDYRTLADNLSTMKNYSLDASPAALGLSAGEYVTEFMFVFGTVKAGFAQVDAPYIFCQTNHWLTGGYQFTNKTDVGGLFNGQWIMASDRWVTAVYKPETRTLPKTGY